MSELITPLVVSRGDVDLTGILETVTGPGVRPLSEQQVAKPVVWNNAAAGVDLRTFGTFAAAAVITTPLVYFQDDDCLVERWPALLDVWETGWIVCNMAPDFQKAYSGKRDKLIGHGSIFEASLVKQTFDRYFKEFNLDYVLSREANRIFTALNFDRCRQVDVGHIDLPYASLDNRLWRQPDHAEMHREAVERADFILRKEGRI